MGYGALVQEILHTFLLFSTHGTLRRSCEAPFDQVIPSEYSFVKNLPEEDGYFGPGLEFPYINPQEVLLVWFSYSDVIFFLDAEHA